MTRYSPEQVRVREWIGDALHAVLHPKHSWSGCSNPDLVYVWIDRLGTYMTDHPAAGDAFVALAADAKDPAA